MPQTIGAADRRTSRALAEAVTEKLVSLTSDHYTLAARASAARLAELKVKLTDYLRSIRSSEPVSPESHVRRDEMILMRHEDLERLSDASRPDQPEERRQSAERRERAAIG